MKVTIIDGYTDEPAGLGVPPYIDIYPRYIAGAVWHVKPSADVRYFTVDYVRKNLEKVLKIANLSDIVIFIAGIVVPGRYLGGEPIKADEITRWPLLMERPLKLLVGPAARFGFGLEGGKPAISPKKFENSFDLVVRGDPEIVIYDLLIEKSLEKVNPYKVRENYDLTSIFAVKGAKIVLQHPNHGKNLIAELETFRGCPRWVSGGCSFCIEPRYGKVVFRDPEDIAKEVEALHMCGVRNFRLGRQSDILVYMSKETNDVEFPKPDPKALGKLLSMVRRAAPDLEVLHIDNVNPGTVAMHPDESKEAAKVIIRYHTSGDVAAMGLESADPDVVKANNLKVMPDDAIKAIEIINSVGSRRGSNGLPELLPGINFIGGLEGESPRTYIRNKEFLNEVLAHGLLVRRINIRQVLPLPGTKMWDLGAKNIVKCKREYERFKRWVREVFDKEMLQRVVPRGVVLKGLYVEGWQEGYCLARQVGSYPLLTYLTERYELWKKVDAVVVGYRSRSVIAVPYPLNPNTASPRSLRMLPGSSKEIAKKIMVRRPFRSIKDLESALQDVKGKHVMMRYLAVDDQYGS